MKFWAVVLGCLTTWCSFWALVGGYHGYQHYLAQNEGMKASAAKNMQDMIFWNDASHNHAAWITSALMNGLIWPVPIVISIGLGWLVFRKLNYRTRIDQ